MPGPRMVIALGVVGLGTGALVACENPDAAPAPAVQVIEAVVLDVAAELPLDPDAPEELPVVYVISGSDEAFSAQVQASVANALTDLVDVRFADARDESLDGDRPGSPVRDGGALVQIGKLVPDESPMAVDVEVYRSETQFSRRVITFGRRGKEWSPSDSSVLEEMDVPPTTEDRSDDEDGDDDEDADGAPASSP